VTRITIIDNINAIEAICAEAVGAIAADISDRRGFQWDDLDWEIRNEIKSAWNKIVETAARRHLLSPEDLAMLQALYSRSPKMVEEHLAKVREVGAGNFMGSYYVGFGHASIGDCGATTIFIEGVTMLAAKAIQDWPLYSGQEASTRYMDFSNVPFENPLGTAEGEAIQERWRAFYLNARERVREHILQKYPRNEGEDEKTYERAVTARCFDVLRAFLPAGAHTNLSWTTNLRQANDKLRWLSRHPDPSIAKLGQWILDASRSAYPNSFGADSLKTSREGGRAEAVEEYTRRVMKDDYFVDPSKWPFSADDRVWVAARVDDSATFCSALTDRPRGAEIPPWLSEIGILHTHSLLDFGSYRDLQRHRSGTIRMPLLTTNFGFHPWYLEEMPADLRHEAEALIAEQREAIGFLYCAPVVAQNYVAMGFRVPCQVTQALPGFVYRMELRSSKTVHPTLRQMIHREAAWFRVRFPHIALYIDADPDSWTVRRGKQTIEAR